MKYYLAIDLGATSGRHVVGFKNESGEIVMEEVHRFKTGVDETSDGLCWNVPRIYNEIVAGIKKAFQKYKTIESLAIDSWAVDYVLLDKDDNPILPYYAYRNERNNKELCDRVHSIIPFEKLYERTGIQLACFNTIYQLYSDKEKGRFSNAKDMLMLPEYFSFLLTGNKAREYTNASSTGLINLETKKFDEEIISLLGLPSFVNSPLVQPGYFLGNLKEDISKEVGGNTKVILCASHDTGSAFEAVETKPNSVLISSGTWSLLGIKSSKAISSKAALEANFTNEGGVGYIRFLKNIMGMWIPNNVANILNLDIPTICSNLKQPDFDFWFNANDPSLLNPSNMYDAVLTLLPRKPKSNEDLFQSIYLSLAICYKDAIEQLEKITGDSYNSIYIIGGGANNKYLNNLVTQITKKEVIALPIEATCLGNLKIQINN